MPLSLCVASVWACVSGPQVFDGSLDACQGTILSSHPHCGGWRGKERDEGMAEGSRFAFNEGKAGRQTVDDAEGREAGC